jgi:hypothetical protein
VALQRRPLALLDSLPAHGDLVEIRLGPRAAYVVCHPGLARQVLTDIGEDFARAEATLILATTAARWNISPDPGTQLSPAARAVLVPRAFPVHLSARPRWSDEFSIRETSQLS